MATTQRDAKPVGKSISAPRASDDNIFGQVALVLLVLLLIALAIATVV